MSLLRELDCDLCGWNAVSEKDLEAEPEAICFCVNQQCLSVVLHTN